MRACTTASGGVMFIEDNIQKEPKSVSYSDLVKEKPEKAKTFGKRKTAPQAQQKAA